MWLWLWLFWMIGKVIHVTRRLERNGAWILRGDVIDTP